MSHERLPYERLAYDDQDSAPKMHEDCTACGSQLRLPAPRLDGSAMRVPSPSLEFDSYPHETRKAPIEVSAAAAHLASRLHLHLD